MRSTGVTPSATTVPSGRLARAISTPSSECRRMTGLMVMAGLLRRVASGEWRMEKGSSPIRYPPFAIRIGSRLAGGILPGLVDLHLGVDRHQADLVRQRHQLE